MGVVEKRDSLLSNLARLRRAERELPLNRDLAAVRAALEEELGETVSLRAAARLLGFSHTALRRWVNSGDLPVVFDSSGRQRVPVGVLMDLHHRLEADRRRGKPRTRSIADAFSEGRQRAEGLDPRQLVADVEDRLEGHRRADLRSLAYHRALAERLDRRMVDDVLRQLWNWRERRTIDPRYADRWEEILRRPLADIRRAIATDDAGWRALRQTSPFAGMLSEPERRKILREIR